MQLLTEMIYDVVCTFFCAIDFIYDEMNHLVAYFTIIVDEMIIDITANHYSVITGLSDQFAEVLFT